MKFQKHMNTRRILSLLATGLWMGPAVNAGEPAKDPWLKEAAVQVLTPKSDRVAPVAVERMEGDVQSAEAMLAQDGKSCRLSYGKDGAKPVIVLDFGKQSVGGYAVFKDRGNAQEHPASSQK